ncbi:hypothetical protein PT2222_140374 [Paraburkholderia tropica]
MHCIEMIFKGEITWLNLILVQSTILKA